MKRVFVCSGVVGLLGSALVGASATQAQAAYGDSIVDLAGTITIVESADTATADSSYHHRASMQLALQGPMYWLHSGTGSEMSYTSAAVQSISYVHNMTYVEGDIACSRNWNLTGWTTTPTVRISFGSTGRDQLSGKTKAHLELYNDSVQATAWVGGSCGGYPENLSIIDRQDQFAPTKKGIFSSWQVDNTESEVVVSPEWITFTKAGSRWVSQGAKTVNSGAYNLTVSWNLTSKVPSGQCVVPASKKVKNKTIAQAKKVIKKAGFKPGKAMRTKHHKGKRGRVFGLQAKMFGKEAACGSKVHMYVRK